jgi:hypothetical protein
MLMMGVIPELFASITSPSHLKAFELSLQNHLNYTSMFPSLDNGPFSATTATGEHDSNPLQPALGMTSCKLHVERRDRNRHTSHSF